MKRLLALVFSLAVSSQVMAQAELLTGSVEVVAGKGRIGLQCTHSGKVTKVHPGSPAAISGIVPGDQILSVNGVAGDVSHIHGTPGTTVALTVKRGDEEFAKDVDRIDERFIMPYSVSSTNLFQSN